MSRKRKSGKRDRSGKLLRPKTRAERAAPFDHGNAVVQARAKLFEVFRGSKVLKAEEHCDGPGQAHLAGLFDGLPADPVAIRDVAREFGDLYWYFYADLQAKGANLGGSSGGKSHRPDTGRDRRFAALDKALGSMASPQRQAVYALCVDYWGSDETAPFLIRLINEARAKKGRAVAGQLATKADKALWFDVCRGLLLMVSGDGTSVAEKRSAA